MTWGKGRCLPLPGACAGVTRDGFRTLTRPTCTTAHARMPCYFSHHYSVRPVTLGSPPIRGRMAWALSTPGLPNSFTSSQFTDADAISFSSVRSSLFPLGRSRLLISLDIFAAPRPHHGGPGRPLPLPSRSRAYLTVHSCQNSTLIVGTESWAQMEAGKRLYADPVR